MSTLSFGMKLALPAFVLGTQLVASNARTATAASSSSSPTTPAAPIAGSASEPRICDLTLEGDRVSARCDHAPLSTVVEQLARAADLQLQWRDGVSQESLSIELSRVPLEQAIDRMLKGRSYTLISKRQKDGRAVALLTIGGEQPRAEPRLANEEWSMPKPGAAAAAAAAGTIPLAPVGVGTSTRDDEDLAARIEAARQENRDGTAMFDRLVSGELRPDDIPADPQLERMLARLGRRFTRQVPANLIESLPPTIELSTLE